MPTTTASMYDPAQGGMNGNPNGGGCSGVKAKDVPWSVAHKTLPCGTVVSIVYGQKTVVVPVADRGPYVAGRDLDLRPDVAKALGITGLGKVTYKPVWKINLKDFAAAGGTQAAYETMVGGKAATDESGVKGGGIPNPLSGLDGVARAIAGAVAVLGKIVADVTDPKVWLRIGEILFGAVLLIIALDKLTGGMISGTAKTAGKAALL